MGTMYDLSFWGSRIPEEFTWLVLPRVFQETTLKVSSETTVISWLNWGRICFYALWHGCWKTPGDSLPGLLKWASFQRCLRIQQPVSGRGGDPRGNEREHTRRKPRSSYNLVMGQPITCAVFYSLAAHIRRKGVTQRRHYQEAGIIVGQLKDSQIGKLFLTFLNSLYRSVWLGLLISSIRNLNTN